jgi:ribonuclease HI
MDEKEALDRLDTIVELIDRHLDSRAPILLLEIKALANGTEEEWAEDKLLKKINPEEKIIISCDASIKVNPGGPAAVGVVIQVLGKQLQLSQRSSATSNNQAEYDAVYFGLISLMNLHNNPGMLIEVRSDSQLVIRQLNGEIKCHDEKLEKKRNMIQEYVGQLPVPVKFQWRPRNSTPELKLANYLAQDLLQIPRH